MDLMAVAVAEGMKEGRTCDHGLVGCRGAVGDDPVGGHLGTRGHHHRHPHPHGRSWHLLACARLETRAQH